ncbi:MAG: nuclear transport factor 2 family protein [Pseudomonadota bacterium]
MHHILKLSLAVAFAVAANLSFAATAEVLDAGIAAVRQLATAQKNFDQAAINAILAPDYVEISPIGEVDARARVLGFYGAEQKAQAANAPVQVLDLEQISARAYGESVVVVVARWPSIFTGKDGKSTEQALRVVYVASKIGDKWQVVSAQYTGIRK